MEKYISGTLVKKEAIVPTAKKDKLQSYQNFWVLEDGRSESEKPNLFQVKNDRIKMLVDIEPGDHVKVSFNINTSSHKGTTFNNLHATSIIKL